MEVTSSIREEDGKTQVTITLTPEEVEQHVKGYFKELGKNRIPGFRPGKAPRKVLEQYFGGHKAVFEDFAQRIVEDVTPKAVDDKDIIFINDPDFEDLSVLVSGEPFSWTVFGKVKPTLELLTYDPVDITLPSAEVSEAEIDAQLQALREYYYTFETIDGPAEMDNYVKMAITCTNKDGEPIEEFAGDTRLIELGQGIMPAAFDEQIVGMKADETKEFDFEPGDSDDFAYMGEGPIHAQVTVEEVRKKKLPESDEEFAKALNVESVDEIRKQFRDVISADKARALPQLKEDRCVAALALRAEGKAPQSYINYTRDDLLRNFFYNLQNENKTFDQYLEQNNLTADQFQKDLDKQAEDIATENLALDALFTAREMEITEEDIDKEFEAVENGDQIRKNWEENGRMAFLRESIRRSKAVEWLLETANVTEESTEPVIINEDEAPEAAEEPAAEAADENSAE